jgi:hypothetical protein
MGYWWDAESTERFWCEITDRPDVGADLKCPQTNESGKHWSYSFIGSVAPGRVVFHYSTTSRSFVGASVAGGPVESRPIVWAPHGTVERSQGEDRQARPGWRLPLNGYCAATRLVPTDGVSRAIGGPVHRRHELGRDPRAGADPRGHRRGGPIRFHAG